MCSVLVPYIGVMKLKVFFLWWQSHIWLLFHLWMSNMAAVLFVSQPSWMANCGLEALLMHWGIHLQWLPLLFFSLLCSLEYQCMTLLHQFWCAWLLFLLLHFLCSCVWIANMLWIAVSLVYIVFWCSIGVSTVVFLESSMIGLHHLSWKLPLVIFCP